MNLQYLLPSLSRRIMVIGGGDHGWFQRPASSQLRSLACSGSPAVLNRNTP